MKHFGFVMEQTLGHVTHHQNLARWVEEEPDICPLWMPIVTSRSDLWERVPGIRSNWSLKASLRARDALNAALRAHPIQALFLHTQTVALFAVPIMQRIPTIVSLDATPLNYDTVGAAYGHAAGGSGWLERRKFRWNRATFHAAAELVTWCRWAKDSLVSDYGVPAERVTVIPPGVDLAQWRFEPEVKQSEDGNRPVRLLFVGADFTRKGGRSLLEAFQGSLQGPCELDIVTREEGVERDVEGFAGARVHRGLTANSAPLKELFARADIFVFPTLADCLPIAVMEAMAAGLPVISTAIGALREEVEENVNGLIVPPGDAKALTAAVRALVKDPTRRRAMSAASREKAEQQFDARRNYRAIVAKMKQIAK